VKGKDLNIFLTGGTGFIGSHVAKALLDAGDLTKLYIAVLHRAVNKQIYLGLGTEFITWEEIARTAVAITGSKSRIIVIDKGYNKEPKYYLVKKIEKHFKLVFKAREKNHRTHRLFAKNYSW